MTPVQFIHNVVKPLLLDKGGTLREDRPTYFVLNDGTTMAYNREGTITYRIQHHGYSTYPAGDQIDLYDAIEFFSDKFKIPEQDFVDRIKSLGEIAKMDLDDYNNAKNYIKHF